MVRILCVDHLGIGLQRALSENRIRDRATSETRGFSPRLRKSALPFEPWDRDGTWPNCFIRISKPAVVESEFVQFLIHQRWGLAKRRYGDVSTPCRRFEYARPVLIEARKGLADHRSGADSACGRRHLVRRCRTSCAYPPAPGQGPDCDNHCCLLHPGSGSSGRAGTDPGRRRASSDSIQASKSRPPCDPYTGSPCRLRRWNNPVRGISSG